MRTINQYGNLSSISLGVLHYVFAFHYEWMNTESVTYFQQLQHYWRQRWVQRFVIPAYNFTVVKTERAKRHGAKRCAQQ